MDFGLKGKNALVVASSKGIGRAVAEALLREGSNVAVCSRNKENLENSFKENRHDNNPLLITCDINKVENIADTVKTIEDSFGGIDILVNNCGGPAPGNMDDIDDSKWRYAYEQVLMSAIRFTRLAIPKMKENNWGRIINITSISVKQPIDNLLLSNTFRSGLIAFAKSLSNEVAKYNITINNVAPGYTLTSRLYELALSESKKTGKSQEDVLNSMAEKIPMQRLAQPDEIASLVTFLASDKAGYITGTTIQIDGGLIKSTY